ncbi:MAG: tRNA-dihydrouridine synthase A [Gammaproteobacteria bacterium]|jgi:tRNA-dihydrouridine synthase A
MAKLNRRFCIAPMMDCSDRHSRYFLRLMSPNILLYTEMVTAAAIVHGDVNRLLSYNSEEHPVAVQLGGSDPEQLYKATLICNEFGYDEVNLNCGCPSDRVQSGRFGACLMAETQIVSECIDAMISASRVPITVKHRTGIDKQDDYDVFSEFANIQIKAGVDALIVHARNAWLKGLSPKQNREIPPLKYDWVYQLKVDYPDTQIIINGGIKTIPDAQVHLDFVDGVMLGREPYANPWVLESVEEQIFGQEKSTLERLEVLRKMYLYIEKNLDAGVPLTRMVPPIIGLFHGQNNGRQWRRYLSENAPRRPFDISVLLEAESFIDNTQKQAS